MILRAITGGSYLSAVGGVVLAVLVTVNVIIRVSTGRGIPGAEEGSVLLLVIIVFAGFGQAESSETHVRVTLLTDRLSEPIQRTVERISLIVAAAFVLLITYMTGLRATSSIVDGEVTIGIVTMPVWPSRIVVSIGFLLFGMALTRKALFPNCSRTIEPKTTTKEVGAHVTDKRDG